LMRKISGSEAFKALMCTLFNMLPGPPVGAPLSVCAPLEPIKGRARTLRTQIGQTLSYTQEFTLTLGQGFLPPNLQTIHHIVDVGYYAPAA
jgi:hypothetical protein